MELFAGVGGFRLGLEGFGTPEHPECGQFKVVWSNQWEPSTKRQHASDVYVERWGAKGHSNEDIFSIVEDATKFAEVAALAPDVLVGGFPCQDYSVAKPAGAAAGLQGKKGVLWWAIHGALTKLQAAGQPVKYLILENVDRLLKSPTKCRGRDFAIILSSLAALGYAVEWRVVNAADYGFPQRRRRVFMVAYHRSTELFWSAPTSTIGGAPESWLVREGVLAAALPVDGTLDTSLTETFVGADPLEAQASYTSDEKGRTRFMRAGVMVEGKVWTADVDASAELDLTRFIGQGTPLTLGDVVAETPDVPSAFYLSPDSIPNWRNFKDGKSELRVTAEGFEYRYSEGPLAFPDPLDRPSRTIITGEGGSTASRTKHVVMDRTGELRRLVPEELEELNGFPRGFTCAAGVSDTKRAFLMGNALVVGVVKAIGRALRCHHDARVTGACKLRTPVPTEERPAKTAALDLV